MLVSALLLATIHVSLRNANHSAAGAETETKLARKDGYIAQYPKG